MPELRVKKYRTKIFEYTGSDSEYDDKKDTEWKLRDKKRSTKTPTPAIRVS